MSSSAGVLFVPDANLLKSACESLTEVLLDAHHSRFRVIPLNAPNEQTPTIIGVLSKDAVLGSSLPKTWHGFIVGRVHIDPAEADEHDRNMSLYAEIVKKVSESKTSLRIPRLITALEKSKKGFSKAKLKLRILELVNDGTLSVGDNYELSVKHPFRPY